MVYVAVDNYGGHGIGVAMSMDGSCDFQTLPDPFPGLTITSHPRLFPRGRRMYLMAPDDSRSLYLTSHDGMSWQPPIRVAGGFDNRGHSVQLAPGVETDDIGYSYSVGPANDGSVQVRVWYDAFDSGRAGGSHFVKGATCVLNDSDGTLAPAGCAEPATWTSTSGVQAFRPAVEYAVDSGGRVAWYVSYMADEGAADGRVHLEARSFALDDGIESSHLRFRTPSEVACTELRGRWGEYDEMRVVDNFSAAPTFSRAYPSSQGAAACAFREGFRAAPVHLDAVRFVPPELR